MQGNQSVPTNNRPMPKDGIERNKQQEEHFWGADYRKSQKSWKEHRKTRYR